jgi:hypothetical protein
MCRPRGTPPRRPRSLLLFEEIMMPDADIQAAGEHCEDVDVDALLATLDLFASIQSDPPQFVEGEDSVAKEARMQPAKPLD